VNALLIRAKVSMSLSSHGSLESERLVFSFTHSLKLAVVNSITLIALDD
jgi:hypothetical protein